MWYFAGIAVIPHNRAWFTAVFSFTCLAFAVTLMRVYSRAVLVRSMGLDDWLMMLAMGLLIAWLATVIEQLRLGLGDHVALEDISEFLFRLFLTILFYTWAQWVIKISILAQYYRIFTTGKARKILRWIFAWFMVYGLTNNISPIFSCTPVKRFWDIMGPGTCINYDALHYVLSTFNTINDFLVLGFPIPFLLKLKLPLQIRIILLITFTCGLFASIVSIMRFQALVINASGAAEDEPVVGVQIIIWSGLEMSIAIICGSVPAIKPLFKLIFPRLDAMSSAASAPQNHHQQPSAQSWVPMKSLQERKASKPGTYEDLEERVDDGIWVQHSVNMSSGPFSDRSSHKGLVPDRGTQVQGGAWHQPTVVNSDSRIV